MADSALKDHTGLVIVNGWAMPGVVWEPLLHALACGRSITQINLDRSYSLEQWLRHLAEVLPEKAVIIGWSLGAQIAIEYAARNPERVLALTALASSPCFVQRVGSGWLAGQSEDTLNGFRRMVSLPPKRLLSRFLALQSLGGMTKTANILGRLQSQDFGPELSQDVLHAGLNILAESDSREALQSLSIPVQYILGETDSVVKLSADQLHAVSHQIQISVIPGMGHYPFGSLVDQIAAKLCSFWSSCPPSVQTIVKEAIRTTNPLPDCERM
ncbi:carboxylesterase BioH [Oleiphilus messinensis]|uniref:Carboxylesterase BioH n=1 Tax=Oleiphilus messinensis TaxID=141451 RepID=A0A1Y0I918_9GAMM|nr:alpha/beta fold hydrolase [Oleiphilus messinensis]ARU55924.1 carboxylesterase BioH [Oleiphilus messinensis]